MDTATLLTLRIPAFEAAIRKAADPSLGSLPVAVVTSFRPLGRVMAACPDARSAGIEEEMHYATARQVCPDAAFFVPDRQLAEQTFRSVWRLALEYWRWRSKSATVGVAVEKCYTLIYFRFCRKAGFDHGVSKLSFGVSGGRRCTRTWSNGKTFVGEY